VHGIGHDVGTLLPGRLADIVLWSPALFGVKPELVLKNGFEAWGALGGGNGSVERVQPVSYGPHWGATGRAGASVGTTFVSQTALDGGIADVLGRRRRLSAVRGTRGLSRADLTYNRAVPQIRIDPSDGTVFLSGQRLASPPVDRVPMNRAYFVS
jgi:urease subunit alpha